MTYERLSGSLGSLLLIWARIELSAREEVVRASNGRLPKSAHGISNILRNWESAVIAVQPASSLCPSLATTLRAALQGPIKIRNGLCHGLIGIIMAQGVTPAKLHWKFNSKEDSISWEELQNLLCWLSKIPRALSIISNPSLERIGSRAIDTAENREWWLAEFGLELPSE